MQKNNGLLKISIVTCCLNADLKIFRKTLDALKSQNYPAEMIEHIVMDGGSKNGAVELAREYNCKVFVRPDLQNKSLVRMSLGIQKAKGDVILFLEPDNIMIGKNWLKEMIRPFRDPEIVATFSIYNTAPHDMPALTRYSALIGANDPTLVYLGKSEKLMRYEDSYRLGRTISKNKDYVKIQFNKKNLPTLGDNGHMVRSKYIKKVNTNPKKFLHTDAFLNLVEKGYDKFGVVNNEIIHYTGSSILDFFRKRVKYKKLFYENRSYKQQYKVFNYKSFDDLKKIILFIAYSLTIVQPLSISIKGYLGKRDIAWFLHPVMCLLAVFSYGFSEIKSRL